MTYHKSARDKYINTAIQYNIAKTDHRVKQAETKKMKLPTSAKTSTSSSVKYPKIKKGYYPAKLTGVKTYSDQNGVLVEQQYGHQLIFEFDIYTSDAEGNPAKPVMIKDAEGKEEPLTMARFLYYESKEPKVEDKPQTYRTAITPKARITKTLEAMGWKFSADGVDLDDFIGKRVDANINDFPKTLPDGTEIVRSLIQDVGPMEGTVKEEAEKPQPTTPKEPEAKEEVKSEVIIALEAKIAQIQDMHKSGIVSESALEKAVEIINADIEKARG